MLGWAIRGLPPFVGTERSMRCKPDGGVTAGLSGAPPEGLRVVFNRAGGVTTLDAPAAGPFGKDRLERGKSLGPGSNVLLGLNGDGDAPPAFCFGSDGNVEVTTPGLVGPGLGTVPGNTLFGTLPNFGMIAPG